MLNEVPDAVGGITVPRWVRGDSNRVFKENPRFVNSFNLLDGINLDALNKNVREQLKESLYEQGIDKSVLNEAISLQYQRHTVSVESHVDEDFYKKRFALWVLNARKRKDYYARFETAALFRYYDLQGKKQEVRLTPGMFIVFNQNKPHELLYCGEDVTLAVGEVPYKARKRLE